MVSTSSRMPILPMSCSRPAVRMISMSSSDSPSSAAIMAERSATRAEWPREKGSLASRALTSTSRVAIETRSSVARSRRSSAARMATSSFSHWLTCAVSIWEARRRSARSRARPRSTRSIGLMR